MEQSPQTPASPKTHLQWGILTAVVMIVLFVVYYVFAVPQQGFARWIPTLLFVVLIILAQQAYGKAMANRVTYGELFANGFKTTAVTTSLYVVFMILFLIIVPGFKEQSLNMAREAMEKKGNMTEDQINMAMSFTAKYFTVFMLAGTIFGTLIAGVIASLIGAAIARKEGKSAPPAS